jgi:hypothetical protein
VWLGLYVCLFFVVRVVSHPFIEIWGAAPSPADRECTLFPRFLVQKLHLLLLLLLLLLFACFLFDGLLYLCGVCNLYAWVSVCIDTENNF